MSNLSLRRKVGYKECHHAKKRKTTSMGRKGLSPPFCALDERKRDAACEMDTVIERARDRRCILTLFMRPLRF